MTLFKAIDDWTLGRCTRVAHAFQRLTGRTNFFLAKMGVAAAIIDLIMRILNHFHQFLYSKDGSFNTAVWFLLVLMLVHDALRMDEAERSHISEERVAIPGVTGYSTFHIRFIFLSASVVSTWLVVGALYTIINYRIIDVIGDLSFVYGVSIYFYFIAVEPLRPQKSKVRQWVEKLSLGTPKAAHAES
ncbi:hypothetical protein KW785_03420 [Candidatus Parcubacteria bacterium]|nr:hypothetical protein [Candidatus Parcubacteria bacterium]